MKSRVRLVVAFYVGGGIVWKVAIQAQGLMTRAK